MHAACGQGDDVDPDLQPCFQVGQGGPVPFASQVDQCGDDVPGAGVGGVQCDDCVGGGGTGGQLVVDQDQRAGATQQVWVARKQQVAGGVRVLLLEPGRAGNTGNAAPGGVQDGGAELGCYSVAKPGGGLCVAQDEGAVRQRWDAVMQAASQQAAGGASATGQRRGEQCTANAVAGVSAGERLRNKDAEQSASAVRQGRVGR